MYIIATTDTDWKQKSVETTLFKSVVSALLKRVVGTSAYAYSALWNSYTFEKARANYATLLFLQCSQRAHWNGSVDDKVARRSKPQAALELSALASAVWGLGWAPQPAGRAAALSGWRAAPNLSTLVSTSAAQGQRQGQRQGLA